MPGDAADVRNMRQDTQGNMPPHSGHFLGYLPLSTSPLPLHRWQRRWMS